MSASWSVSDGTVTRSYLSTDLVGYSAPDDGFDLLCLWCADMGYGAVIQEMPPVHVGDLLGSDTPDPRCWLCSSCEANILTYL